ncbi:tetratricopeptide repeat protein [Gammaproteobacteria bacterium]|nr:tetratricopeptide repeat protein [Pseudomonadales bacterium]MDC0238040.1 tetratricopeptide repeat protein [Gammaproteobacteria bacterium]
MDANPTVFEIDPNTFQTDVVERSKQVPVILLFWTDQVAPAADTKRVLETLVAQYQGKFALGLSDVAKDQALAQQLRVQGIPSIRVVADGQITEQMEGPQGEAALRELVDKLTMSGSDLLRDQLAVHLASEDWDNALAILQQAIDEEPNNAGYKVEWADLLVRKGDLDGARTVVATIPEETPDRERPVTRLEIAEEAAGMGNREDVQVELDADPSDLDLRYRASILCAAGGQYEEALEHAMFILQTDREFQDDIGRATMVRIMSLLGKDADIAKRYRRRMFNFMH